MQSDRLHLALLVFLVFLLDIPAPFLPGVYVNLEHQFPCGPLVTLLPEFLRNQLDGWIKSDLYSCIPVTPCKPLPPKLPCTPCIPVFPVGAVGPISPALLVCLVFLLGRLDGFLLAFLVCLVFLLDRGRIDWARNSLYP